MLIDCFPFFNEIHLLRYRLDILKDVVDTTVIVEANETFSGKPKVLHYKENERLFKDYNIVHVVVDLPNADPWTRERTQRNGIDIGLDEIQPYPHDHIMISDIDEIPDPDTIKHLVETEAMGIHTLEQDLYYYHLECRARSRWHKAKFLDAHSKCIIGEPEKVRHHSAPHVMKGGWHFSYFGDPTFIKAKIEAFSHQEVNQERYKDPKHIIECARSCKDLFGRGDGWLHIPVTKNNYLPPNWRAL